MFYELKQKVCSMRGRLALPLVIALNACVPAPQGDVTRAASIATSTLPPLKYFTAGQQSGPIRSNNDLALDFVELSFKMESGRDLPTFTRFEGAITLRVTGAQPPTLQPDLTRLLWRLRREAGIQISQTDNPNASITIEAVPRAQIQSVLPRAACFVAPNVSSLEEYRLKRNRPDTNWTLLTKRTRMSVFLPNDVSPQEARDCLHEEIAQALGPLNDLYRLPDSVFNDDNIHTVLTGFDMMMLRAYYSPQLKNGMTRGEVVRRLPSILTQINPAGNSKRGSFTPRTPRDWKIAVNQALGPSASTTQRRKSATTAVRIAKELRWTGSRRAFSHYAMGRVLQGSDPKKAQEHFVKAERYYAQTPGTRLHRAYVATQLAAYAITQGQGTKADRLVIPHIATARSHENAALMSTLMMIRAEALDLQSRTSEANAVRLDSLGWARYGFGSDWAVRAKLKEIASLSPLKG